MGIPLLDVNLRKLRKKACEVISVMNSRCTALTVQQVYRHIQTFLVLEAKVSLVYRGAAKSIPVYENGGVSLTLRRGNGGEGASVRLALKSSSDNTFV